MKNILILLSVTSLLLSCNNPKKENATQNVEEMPKEVMVQPKNFNWLLGKWQRLNDVEDKQTFENWEKVSPTEYFGVGFTMQNGDTISMEKIRLSKLNEQWNVAVKTEEESEPVVFKIKSHTTNEFVCENKENDFPHTIKYWKEGELLKAIISNDDMAITFDFTRL